MDVYCINSFVQSGKCFQELHPYNSSNCSEYVSNQLHRYIYKYKISNLINLCCMLLKIMDFEAVLPTKLSFKMIVSATHVTKRK